MERGILVYGPNGFTVYPYMTESWLFQPDRRREFFINGIPSNNPVTEWQIDLGSIDDIVANRPNEGSVSSSSSCVMLDGPPGTQPLVRDEDRMTASSHGALPSRHPRPPPPDPNCYIGEDEEDKGPIVDRSARLIMGIGTWSVESPVITPLEAFEVEAEDGGSLAPEGPDEGPQRGGDGNASPPSDQGTNSFTLPERPAPSSPETGGSAPTQSSWQTADEHRDNNGCTTQKRKGVVDKSDSGVSSEDSPGTIRRRKKARVDMPVCYICPYSQNLPRTVAASRLNACPGPRTLYSRDLLKGHLEEVHTRGPATVAAGRGHHMTEAQRLRVCEAMIRAEVEVFVLGSVDWWLNELDFYRGVRKIIFPNLACRLRSPFYPPWSSIPNQVLLGKRLAHFYLLAVEDELRGNGVGHLFSRDQLMGVFPGAEQLGGGSEGGPGLATFGPEASGAGLEHAAGAGIEHTSNPSFVGLGTGSTAALSAYGRPFLNLQAASPSLVEPTPIPLVMLQASSAIGLGISVIAATGCGTLSITVVAGEKDAIASNTPSLPSSSQFMLPPHITPTNSPPTNNNDSEAPFNMASPDLHAGHDGPMNLPTLHGAAFSLGVFHAEGRSE